MGRPNRPITVIEALCEEFLLRNPIPFSIPDLVGLNNYPRVCWWASSLRKSGFLQKHGQMICLPTIVLQNREKVPYTAQQILVRSAPKKS